MTDRLITAPANCVTPADFLRAAMSAFAAPKNRTSERADATAVYIGDMLQADPKDEAAHHRIRAEYAAALAEIDARYAETKRRAA